MAAPTTNVHVLGAESANEDADLLPPLKSHGRSIALWEITSIAWGSLLANKMRSLLTMLGIIIGVASLVALLALGNGVSAQITGQVTSLGTNLLTIIPGSPDNDGGPGQSRASAPLTSADVAAIQKLQLPVNGIAPEFSSAAQIVAPAADTNASIVGITDDYPIVNNLTIASGTFFSERDIEGGAAVVVLGSTLKTDLFGAGEAVGQTVRIKNIVARVVGVLEEKGGGGFGSVDDQAFVPLEFAQRRLFGARAPGGNGWEISYFSISVTRSEDIPAVRERVSSVLRLRHELAPNGSEDDFIVLDQSAFLETLSTITGALTAFLAAIAGISLVVGGIGIMNIMLVSVTERTREIGLRKAVGARGRDILLQFLVEALVLSLAGGFIGLVIGGGVALAVTMSGLLDATVTLSSVILSLSFSIAVGVFFGFYPARRAARLNPIDALRHE